MCIPCRGNEKSNSYIFLCFPFSKHVWSVVENLWSLQNLWGGETLDNYFHEWLSINELKVFRYDHFLVLLGVWIARNTSIFQEKNIPSFQVKAQITSLFSYYKHIQEVLQIGFEWML